MYSDYDSGTFIEASVKKLSDRITPGKSFCICSIVISDLLPNFLSIIADSESSSDAMNLSSSSILSKMFFISSISYLLLSFEGDVQS